MCGIWAIFGYAGGKEDISKQIEHAMKVCTFSLSEVYNTFGLIMD